MGDIALRGNKLTKGPHGHGPKPYLNKPGQSQGTHGGRIGKAAGGAVQKAATEKQNKAVEAGARKIHKKWALTKAAQKAAKELSNVEAKPHSTEKGRISSAFSKAKRFAEKMGYAKGGHVNTRRENRLEELGRVDAEKAHTSKGKRNLRDEKDRIRSELKKGGWIQDVNKSIKKRGTKGVCTGKKFGGPTCRPGTKRYALAKTFKKMAKKRKG